MESEKINDKRSQEQEVPMDKTPYAVDIDSSENTAEFDDEHAVLDNQFPFPPLHGIPDEDRQLTVRALVIGCLLGAVVSASNIYLGLKTGWTFGASLFGSILGFAILKPLSKFAPAILGGGYFGPKVCLRRILS